MPDKNNTGEEPRQETQTGSATTPENEPDNTPQQQAEKDTDTAPDQFIGPNADTDVPMDGEIINDAVLRGEPNANSNAPDQSIQKGNAKKQQETSHKTNEAKKMMQLRYDLTVWY